MNKIVFTLVMCFAALTNPVWATDNLTISNFVVVPGMADKEFDINLNNDKTYAALQFDLYLPKGITIESFSAENRFPKGTDLKMNQQTDGSYRFIAVPPDLKSNISGTSGSIIKITVSASDTVASGSLIGYFRNVKLSNVNGEGKTYAEIPIPIYSVRTGDVNGDGTIDVADIATVIDVMADSVGADPAQARNADVNGDGTVDVADIATVIDIMAANARRLKTKETE